MGSACEIGHFRTYQNGPDNMRIASRVLSANIECGDLTAQLNGKVSCVRHSIFISRIQASCWLESGGHEELLSISTKSSAQSATHTSTRHSHAY